MKVKAILTMLFENKCGVREYLYVMLNPLPLIRFKSSIFLFGTNVEFVGVIAVAEIILEFVKGVKDITGVDSWISFEPYNPKSKSKFDGGLFVFFSFSSEVLVSFEILFSSMLCSEVLASLEEESESESFDEDRSFLKVL